MPDSALAALPNSYVDPEPANSDAVTTNPAQSVYNTDDQFDSNEALTTSFLPMGLDRITEIRIRISHLDGQRVQSDTGIQTARVNQTDVTETEHGDATLHYVTLTNYRGAHVISSAAAQYSLGLPDLRRQDTTRTTTVTRTRTIRRTLNNQVETEAVILLDRNAAYNFDLGDESSFAGTIDLPNGQQVAVHVNRQVTPDHPTRGIELRMGANALVYKVSAVPVSNEGNKPALTTTGDSPDDPAEFERVIHGSYDIWDQEGMPIVRSISFVNAADLNEEQTDGVIAPPGRKIAAWGGILGFPSKGALVGNRVVYAGIRGAPSYIYTSNANAFSNMAQDRAVLRDQDSVRSGARFLVEAERRADVDLSTAHFTPNGDSVTGVESFHGLVVFTDRSTYLLTDGETTNIDATSASADLVFQFDKGIAREFEPVRVGEFMMAFDANDKDLFLIYPAEQRTGLKYLSVSQLRNDELFAESPIRRIVRYYGGENRQGVIMLREDGQLIFMAVDLNAQSFDDFRLACSRWIFTDHDGKTIPVQDIASFGDDRVQITLERNGFVVTEELSTDVDNDATKLLELQQASKIRLTEFPRGDPETAPVQTRIENLTDEEQLQAVLTGDWTSDSAGFPTEKATDVVAEADNTNGFNGGWLVPNVSLVDGTYYLTLHGRGDPSDQLPPRASPTPLGADGDPGLGVRDWDGEYRGFIDGSYHFGYNLAEYILPGYRPNTRMAWSPPAEFPADALGGSAVTEFPLGSRWIVGAHITPETRGSRADHDLFTIQADASNDFLKLTRDSTGFLSLFAQGEMQGHPLFTLSDGELARLAVDVKRVQYDAPTSSLKRFSVNQAFSEQMVEDILPGTQTTMKVTIIKPEIDAMTGERERDVATLVAPISTRFIPVKAGVLETGFENIKQNEFPAGAFSIQMRTLEDQNSAEALSDQSWVTLLSGQRFNGDHQIYDLRNETTNRRFYLVLSNRDGELFARQDSPLQRTTQGNFLTIPDGVGARIEYELSLSRRIDVRLVFADGSTHEAIGNAGTITETRWSDEGITSDIAITHSINNVGAVAYVKDYDNYVRLLDDSASSYREVQYRLGIGLPATFTDPAVPAGPGRFYANRFRLRIGVTLDAGGAETIETVEGIMLGNFLAGVTFRGETEEERAARAESLFHGNEVPFKVGGRDLEAAITNNPYDRRVRIAGNFHSARVVSFDLEHNTRSNRRRDAVPTYSFALPLSAIGSARDEVVTPGKRYNPIDNRQILLYRLNGSFPAFGDASFPPTDVRMLEDRFIVPDFRDQEITDIELRMNDRGGTSAREGWRIRGEFASLRFIASDAFYGGSYVNTAAGEPGQERIHIQQSGRVGYKQRFLSRGYGGFGDSYWDDFFQTGLTFLNGRARGIIRSTGIGVLIDLNNDGTIDIRSDEVDVGDTAAVDPNAALPHYEWTVFRDGGQIAKGRVSTDDFHYAAGYPKFVFTPPSTGELRLSNRVIAYQPPDTANAVPDLQLADISAPFTADENWTTFIRGEFTRPFAFEFDLDEPEGFHELLVGEMFVGRMEVGLGTQKAADATLTTKLFNTSLLAIESVADSQGRAVSSQLRITSPVLKDNGRVVDVPSFTTSATNRIAWVIERRTASLAELTIAVNGEVVLQEEAEHGVGEEFPLRSMGIAQRDSTQDFYIKEPVFAVVDFEGRADFETETWLSDATMPEGGLFTSLESAFPGNRIVYEPNVPVYMRLKSLPFFVPDFGAYSDFYDYQTNRVQVVVTNMDHLPEIEFRSQDISPPDTLARERFSGNYGRRLRRRAVRRTGTRERAELLNEGIGVRVRGNAGMSVDKLLWELSLESPVA